MDVQPHPHFCGRKPAVVHVLSDSVSLTSPGSSPMHHKVILLQPIARHNSCQYPSLQHQQTFTGNTPAEQDQES